MIPTFQQQGYVIVIIMINDFGFQVNGNVLPTALGKYLPSYETLFLCLRNQQV